MTDRVFNFHDQLKMSHGVSLAPSFRDILISEIPNAIAVRQANDHEDRTGTDWWVDRQNNKPLSIDLKVREIDYGKSDLALEIWSVVEHEIIGWTRDTTKATDYVLWFWKDTKRWCLLPFPMLCRVFSLLWEDWENEYKTARQTSRLNGRVYHSECVFVPIDIVWGSLIAQYCYEGCIS